MIELTGMILAHRQPLCTDLDTLYIWWLGSGMDGMGENHSTYVRWVGVASCVASNVGNTLGIALFGNWKTTWTCAIQWPMKQISVSIYWYYENIQWFPCTPSWEAPQTRTVSKCNGIRCLCKSFCSGWIWIVSTTLGQPYGWNLILW